MKPKEFFIKCDEQNESARFYIIYFLNDKDEQKIEVARLGDTLYENYNLQEFANYFKMITAPSSLLETLEHILKDEQNASSFFDLSLIEKESGEELILYRTNLKSFKSPRIKVGSFNNV